MHDDVYRRLRTHLNTFVLGAPEADAILEILRLRFTPEEAEVALLLGPALVGLEKLARKSGRDESELRPILHAMADKALVFQKVSDEGESYHLLPTAVGLWETSFANGERTPRTEQLAQLWRDYYQKGWGESMFGAVPFTRVIPVGKSVEQRQEILPYEKASELIKQYDYAVVIHCPCRKSAELDGAGCGKPTEVCFHFGDLARFMTHKGLGREVNLDEVMEILDATEKAGLVHMVGNSKAMGVALCSCCPCCCTQLRALKEMANPNAVAKSRFYARVDSDRCISCGVCRERCWAEAVALDGEAAVIPEGRCFGCGLCVSTCPTDAISMAEREGYQAPVDTGLELYQAWLGKK